VLLGLGEDGHIASIFPNQSYDDSRQAISVANAPKMPKNRISLTPSRLSNTENIMFLVVGQNKAEAIRKWKSKGNIPACYVSAKKELSILHFDVD
jgi:6-phosphogluconolactonase